MKKKTYEAYDINDELMTYKVTFEINGNKGFTAVLENANKEKFVLHGEKDTREKIGAYLPSRFISISQLEMLLDVTNEVVGDETNDE
jgi:hypothetical protein